MIRAEFEMQLTRLQVLMPPTRDAEEAERRRILTEELWRKFGKLDSSTWAAIIARVIDTHTRAGPPRPADFSAAEQYLQDKGLGNSTVATYTPPSPEEAEGWCLLEISKMKPAGARYILTMMESRPGNHKFSDDVFQALIIKAGEDSDEPPAQQDDRKAEVTRMAAELGISPEEAEKL